MVKENIDLKRFLFICFTLMVTTFLWAIIPQEAVG
jgi:hypothetical protein